MRKKLLGVAVGDGSGGSSPPTVVITPKSTGTTPASLAAIANSHLNQESFPVGAGMDSDEIPQKSPYYIDLSMSRVEIMRRVRKLHRDFQDSEARYKGLVSSIRVEKDSRIAFLESEIERIKSAMKEENERFIEALELKHEHEMALNTEEIESQYDEQLNNFEESITSLVLQLQKSAEHQLQCVCEARSLAVKNIQLGKLGFLKNRVENGVFPQLSPIWKFVENSDETNSLKIENAEMKENDKWISDQLFGNKKCRINCSENFAEKCKCSKFLRGHHGQFLKGDNCHCQKSQNLEPTFEESQMLDFYLQIGNLEKQKMDIKQELEDSLLEITILKNKLLVSTEKLHKCRERLCKYSSLVNEYKKECKCGIAFFCVDFDGEMTPNDVDFSSNDVKLASNDALIVAEERAYSAEVDVAVLKQTISKLEQQLDLISESTQNSFQSEKEEENEKSPKKEIIPDYDIQKILFDINSRDELIASLKSSLMEKTDEVENLRQALARIRDLAPKTTQNDEDSTPKSIQNDAFSTLQNPNIAALLQQSIKELIEERNFLRSQLQMTQNGGSLRQLSLENQDFPFKFSSSSLISNHLASNSGGFASNSVFLTSNVATQTQNDDEDILYRQIQALQNALEEAYESRNDAVSALEMTSQAEKTLRESLKEKLKITSLEKEELKENLKNALEEKKYLSELLHQSKSTKSFAEVATSPRNPVKIENFVNTGAIEMELHREAREFAERQLSIQSVLSNRKIEELNFEITRLRNLIQAKN